MKVFVDTHIFVDYFLDRSDIINPLSEFAFQFFKRALECRYFIIICQQTIEELCKVLRISEKCLWSDVLKDLKESDKIELIAASEMQLKEAMALKVAKKVPLNDALFAILARDNNALLVSRDKHHYEKLNEIVEVIVPEQLQ